MNKPLFSIVIPIYNADEYLSECLESITAQSRNNYELLLINDGSTDNTLSIITEFAKKRKNVKIINQTNAGVSAARNTGIRNATGKYLLFVDADDHLNDRDTLKYLEAVADKADSVFFDFTTGKRRTSNEETRLYSEKDTLAAFLFRFIKNEQLNPPWNKLYKRKIVIENNLYFADDIKIGEDLLFNINYLRHCNSLYFLAKPLYFYRTDNDNSATKKYMPNKYYELMKVNDALTSWAATYDNKRLDDVVKYIRVKNILSCLRDLSHNNCPLSSDEKYAKMREYKKNNKLTFVLRCGPTPFLVSLIYSLGGATLLTKLITRMRG